VSGTGQAAREVYRPALVRVGAAVYAVFALWWLGSVLLEPAPREALVVAPGLLAGGALVYALFWRPAVVVDGEGVELRNVLRDVRVPWAALEQVDTRYALTLYAAGRRHQSWAAAAPGRPGLLRGRRDTGSGRGPAPGGHPGSGAAAHPRGDASARSSRDLRADSGAAAFLVEHHWAAWRESRARRSGSGAAGSGAAEPVGEPAPAVAVRWNIAAPLVLIAGVLAAVLASAAQ